MFGFSFTKAVKLQLTSFARLATFEGQALLNFEFRLLRVYGIYLKLAKLLMKIKHQFKN